MIELMKKPLLYVKIKVNKLPKFFVHAIKPDNKLRSS